jgi:chromosome partitioning protein
MFKFNDPHDFEQVIGLLFQREGWEIEFPKSNNKGYDIAAQKGGDVAAIQVKLQKSPVGSPPLAQFLDFLEHPIAARFNKGFFISSSGFSSGALRFFAERGKKNVSLEVFENETGTRKQVIDQVIRKITPPITDRTYIGIFTAKGGVGKTIVSAHLAGAFALNDYDVALLDLDPQRSLSLLLDDGLYFRSNGNGLGNTITVFRHQDWDDNLAPEVKIVICDCSPDFANNPPEVMQKLKYCIIPTTLTPLGINRGGEVLANTLQQIRSVNKEAYVFVLLNNVYNDNTKMAQVLKEEYRLSCRKLEKDKRFRFIDTDECFIRHSKQLVYWGSHIYDRTRSKLAFDPVGGRSLPKLDFLGLVGYLENQTSIQQQKP